ncbi:MAG: M17 family peptidase N-terminal domain-containing protein [Pseudomonadota bacterium]
MKVKIIHKALRAANCDVFIVPVFKDERPLSRITGLIDWKLSGRISKLIEKNSFSGELGEKLLFGNISKIGGKNIILIGLGLKKNFGTGSLKNVFDILNESLPSIMKTSVAIAPEQFLSAHVDVSKVVDSVGRLTSNLLLESETNKIPTLIFITYDRTVYNEIKQDLEKWNEKYDLGISVTYE